MIFNVDKIKLQFMLDYKEEAYWIPQSTYLNYSPVLEPEKYKLRTISIEKKYPLCYIKIDDKWAYWIDNKLSMLPLIKDNKQIYGFTKYRIPCVFFIEYLTDELFFLYINTQFGASSFLYLVYDGNNNISFTPDKTKMSYFKYNKIKWGQFVNETKILPILNGVKQKITSK